ncbi:MAG: hypothetical protein AMXMBFR83_11690 [Phycisphaerae bacterium]
MTFLILGFALSWSSGVQAEPQRIAIIRPSAEVYKEPVDHIKDSLTRAGYTCLVVELPALPAEGAGPGSGGGSATTSAPGESDLAAPRETERVVQQVREYGPTLIVAAGANAAALVLHAVPKVPVVFCAVPNALDRSFLAVDTPLKSRVTGVTTDVDPKAQIEWMRRLSPKLTRLGVLYSENSRRTAEALAEPGKAKGISVILIPAGKETFAAAIQELNARQCDGALMIADAHIYNSPNAQALLLWGLRGRKPVWSFSANLVKAGAFAALSAEADDLSDQTVELVKKVISGEKPEKLGLQYPRSLQRAVNRQTAKLIGISLENRLLDEMVTFGRD